MNVKEEVFSRNRPEQDFQNLKRDMELLRKDMAKLTGGLVENAKSSAEQVKDELGKQSEKALRRVEHKITQRPVLSLLVSLTVGMLLAKALMPRH